MSPKGTGYQVTGQASRIIITRTCKEERDSGAIAADEAGLDGRLNVVSEKKEESRWLHSPLRGKEYRKKCWWAKQLSFFM